MNFTDEKDYIMRMIKETIRVLFVVAFGEKYVSVERENKYEVSGKNLKDFLDSMDYTNKEAVMAGALFYEHINEKDNEFLTSNNYTREEVLSGFQQLLEQSGYHDLICLLKEEE